MVYDSDGFTTDYTLYFDNEENNYFTVFGDSDLYGPEDSEHDWDFGPNEDEAREWFEDYEGFVDDDYDDGWDDAAWHDTADQEQTDQPDYMPELTDESLKESKGLSDREIDNFSGSLLRDKKYSDLSDEERRLYNELSCRSMINSILAYTEIDWKGNRPSAKEIVDEQDKKYKNYLKSYIDSLGRDRVIELVQEQMDRIENVLWSVDTDSEGLSYNSIRFKERLEEPVIKRYSDVIPQEERKFWYFTTHGVQPGSIPGDVNVLDTKEGQNKKGTKGTFVLLDAILNTSELKQYDMIELVPDDVDESLNEVDESQTYRGYKIVFHPGYSAWTNMKNYYKVYAPQGHLVGGKATLEKAKEMIDNRIVNKVDESLKEAVDTSLNDNVKSWYLKAYPTDELGQEIDNKLTFNGVVQILNGGGEIYDVLTNDSVIRERVFDELSERLGVDYDVIYYTWLYPDDHQITVNESVSETSDIPNWFVSLYQEAKEKYGNDRASQLRYITIHSDDHANTVKWLNRLRANDSKHIVWDRGSLSGKRESCKESKGKEMIDVLGGLKEAIDISEYEEVKGIKDGDKIYRVFRKIEDGKGKWCAWETSKGNTVGEPFEINYQQALEREPIQTPSGIKELGKKLGKTLLPKLGESIADTDFQDKVKQDILSGVYAYYGHKGWSKKEVDDYIMPIVETDFHEKYYDDGSDALFIEVRAELDYDDLTELGYNLDRLLRKYNKEAYFEPVTSGILQTALWD